VCVECAKEPEYRCENCDKVYKQESRYNAHIAVCGVGAAVAGAAVTTMSASDFSELLRQNREMIDIMRKQQETIQMLVAGLSGGGGGGGGVK
jgi:methionyl-tRNA synthetase